MIESSRIEYKRELSDGLEKEVVAFLNAREGGVIWIGIDNSGEVTGLADCNRIQLVVKDRLKNNIQPSIMGLFDIIHEQRDSKDLIRITVAGGLEKPYYLKKFGMTEKGCFLRVGSAAEPMPQEMIDSLYGRRVRNTIGRMESTRLGLTFEQLKIYYDARGLTLNPAFMQNLELLTPGGKPNFAAYLLADENGVSIQVAKYRSTSRDDLMENRDYGRCCLVRALKDVLSRMDVENTIYTRIGKIEREERPMIDPRALREAVVNAVVHNDYSNGSSPKFEFFKDRLEITSSGRLPYGVTLDDFFGGYSSPRNKEIMRVFRDLELVEQLGSGVPRILEKYDRSVFEIFPNFLRVIFHYAKPFGAEAQVEAQVGLTAWQAEILKACAHKEKSSRDLVETLGYSNRTGHFKRGLQGLLEKGLLEMTRPETPKSRLQKYRLTDSGRTLLDHINKEI
jgi:predicted HTH transcriptional regulator